MRIGILGLGSIGQRHAKNARDLGHEVIAYDPVLLPSEFGDTDIIQHAEAVIIASPTERHLNQLDKCVCIEVPALVEKPIAQDLPHLVAWILEDAKKAKLTIMVGNNLRFHESVIQAKTWINEGLIGKPISGYFKLGQKNTKYNDILLHWGSHELDLACHLLGPATVDECAISEAGDSATVGLTHQCGPSIVVLNYLDEPWVRHANIRGDKGVIMLDLIAGTCEIASADHTETKHATLPFDHTYISELQAFIDRIHGKTTLGASGDDGLATLKLCLEAQVLACAPSP